MQNIFVYGTLLRGFANHSRFLADAKLIDENAQIDGYTLLDLGGVPGAIPHSARSEEVARSHIVGEVYEVSDKCLAQLDRIEGHPDVYCRTPVETTSGLSVFLYVFVYKRVLEQFDATTESIGPSWRAHIERMLRDRTPHLR